MRKKISIFSTFYIAIVMAFFALPFSAHANSIENMLKEPNVADIYLVKINKFSTSKFGDTNDDVFGFLFVTAVAGDEIKVITAKKAWSKLRGASEYMDHALPEVQWDKKEEIVLKRDTLLNRRAEGEIIKIFRWTAASKTPQ